MSHTDSPPFVVEHRGGIHIIQFTSESLIDQAQIQEVGSELERIIVNSGHPKIIIDLSTLSQVSSAMLGVLINLNMKARSMKGQIRIASVPTSIMEVFKLTRLDKLLKIYETTEAAMLKF